MAQYTKISTRCLSLSTALSRRRPVFVGTPPPKKPATPFGLFVKDTFHNSEDKPDAPIRMKQLSEQWNNMEEHDRKVYSIQYHQLKSVYDKEKDSFFVDDSERKKYQDYVKKRQTYLKKKRLMKQGDYDPFPRKLSGFHEYMKEKMAEAVVEERKIAFMKASQDWRHVSEEIKMNYNAKAEKVNKQKILEYYSRNPEKAEENV